MQIPVPHTAGGKIYQIVKNLDDGTMEEKKEKRKSGIGASMLFGFVVLCTLLIAFDMGSHVVASMSSM